MWGGQWWAGAGAAASLLNAKCGHLASYTHTQQRRMASLSFTKNPKFKPQADTNAHTVDARTLREFGRRVFRGANAECIDSEREDGASELVATRCFLSKHDANQSRIKVCVGFPTEQVTPANACKPAAGADVVCLQTIASSFGCIKCCDSCPAFPFAIFALDQRRSGRGWRR